MCRGGRALLVAALLLVLLPAVAHAQAPRIDLRVLLVTDGTPPVEALRGVLDRVGIPVDVFDLNDPARPRIDGPLLADGTNARFQGVVLPDHAPTGLPAAELAALHAYERRFGSASSTRRSRPGRRSGSWNRSAPSATAVPSTAARRS